LPAACSHSVCAPLRGRQAGIARAGQQMAQTLDEARRGAVTAGCVNLMPEVYEQLVDCCRDETPLIRR
jgi:hypothetical protein